MKVHFAGMEKHDNAVVINKVADIKYGLFTVFPFICKDFGIGSRSKIGQRVVNFNDKNFKHCIMDSGLFTLMFGAHAGKRDEKFVKAWQKAIIKFVKDTGYKGTVVEVDCQKILGVESAWKLRKELKKALPNNQQMNVFHIEDGKEGLIKLAKFSDYIALSIPEFRALGWNDIPKKVSQLCRIIKDVKPDIKIHLLGCTQKNIMERSKFCYSSDSTSWMQVLRWGSQIVFKDGKYQKVKTKTVERNGATFEKRIEKHFKKEKVTRTSKQIRYYCSMSIAGVYLKQLYTKHAGSQE